MRFRFIFGNCCGHIRSPTKMATIIVTESANHFDGTAQRRKAYAQIVRSAAGLKVEGWRKRNDLAEEKADGTRSKCYGAVVPIIGGVERIDLRCFTFDLDTEKVTDFSGPYAKQIDVNDDWHVYCRAQDAPNSTYDAWLDRICANFSATFPNGLIIEPFEYCSKTKKGGTWWPALFAGKKA